MGKIYLAEFGEWLTHLRKHKNPANLFDEVIWILGEDSKEAHEFIRKWDEIYPS